MQYQNVLMLLNYTIYQNIQMAQSIGKAQQVQQTIGQAVAQAVKQAVHNASIVNDKLVGNAVVQQSQSSPFMLPLILAITIIAVLLYIVLGKKKAGNQNVMALIGERYSGKTQLFVRLAGGKPFPSVPSIKNNHTTYKSGSKTYQFIDYCGDNISKDEVLNVQNYANIHTLIHVIDGADPTKLGDAALFLYRLLVSKAYQKRECNYVLYLNKSDEENFLGKVKVVKRLQDEIEHIKQSRKNSAEEAEQEEDYLKTTKERFSLQKGGIKVVSGSAKKGEIKQLESVLQGIL